MANSSANENRTFVQSRDEIMYALLFRTSKLSIYGKLTLQLVKITPTNVLKIMQHISYIYTVSYIINDII